MILINAGLNRNKVTSRREKFFQRDEDLTWRPAKRDRKAALLIHQRRKYEILEYARARDRIKLLRVQCYFARCLNGCVAVCLRQACLRHPFLLPYTPLSYYGASLFHYDPRSSSRARFHLRYANYFIFGERPPERIGYTVKHFASHPRASDPRRCRPCHRL